MYSVSEVAIHLLETFPQEIKRLHSQMEHKCTTIGSQMGDEKSTVE